MNGPCSGSSPVSKTRATCCVSGLPAMRASRSKRVSDPFLSEPLLASQSRFPSTAMTLTATRPIGAEVHGRVHGGHSPFADLLDDAVAAADQGGEGCFAHRMLLPPREAARRLRRCSQVESASATAHAGPFAPPPASPRGASAQLAVTNCESASGGSTHCPPSPQTAGDTQSRSVAHDVWQPAALHVYGVQSVVCPFAPVIVCWPSHVTPDTHVPVPTSQRSPPVQSASLAHLLLHVVPPHTNGAQSFVSGVGQLPLPSQAAASVATPFAQLACTHVTDEPTNPVHDVRVLPSHCAALHGLSAEPFGHAARVPCGAPATGVHVPSLPSTSHASHCPVHAPLQQTPSTQKPLTHAPFEPHAWPASSVPWHWPFVQNAPAAQSLVPLQPEGQMSDVPEHEYGEHVGLPA